jgi:hypothetical protein
MLRWNLPLKSIEQLKYVISNNMCQLWYNVGHNCTGSDCCSVTRVSMEWLNHLKQRLPTFQLLQYISTSVVSMISNLDEQTVSITRESDIINSHKNHSLTYIVSKATYIAHSNARTGKTHHKHSMAMNGDVALWSLAHSIQSNATLSAN